MTYFARIACVRPERHAHRDSRDAIRRAMPRPSPVPQNKAELKSRIAVGNTVVDHELVIRARRRAVRDHRHYTFKTG